MKRIAIFKSDRPAAESSAVQMADALNKEGLDTYDVREYRNAIIVSDPEGVRMYDATGGPGYTDYDLVYLRDFQNYEHEINAIATLLHTHGTPFINTEAVHFAHRSKLTQNIQFLAAGLPVPRFAYCHASHMLTVVKNHGFSFPLVLKSITGSNGEENFLVKDEAAFVGALDKIGDKKYLLQEFVPNDSDYRVIVFRDTVACAYRRIRGNGQDYLNNVKTGATRELIEADAQLTHIAVTAAKSLRRELVGIDVVKNSETGGYAILEANLNFGMTDLPDGVPEAYFAKIATLINQYAAQL